MVDLADLVPGIEHGVADRREVEYLGIARQRGLGRLARAAQFLVLQLELDAMDLELACQLRARHLLRTAPGDGGFRPATKAAVIALGHDKPPLGRTKTR